MTTGQPSETISRVEGGPTRGVYRGSSGALSVSWSNGSARILLEGHGHAGFAPIIIRHWDALLHQRSAVTLLADCWDMRTYDSSLRIDLTEWLRRERRGIAALHVLTKSRIVSMGVAVANLALGGMVTHHRTRTTFDEVAAGLSG